MASSEKIGRRIGLAVWLTVIVTWALFRFYVYPVVGYYTNFGQWVLKMKTRDEYFSWFNPQVSTNYAVAAYVMNRTSRDEPIFVWGDEPMVYALAHRGVVGKYTVKYHVGDFGAHAQTLKALVNEEPAYIVSLSEEKGLPGLRSVLQDGYLLDETIGNARIYRKKARNW